jgi:hypothetical protein
MRGTCCGEMGKRGYAEQLKREEINKKGGV